MSEAHIKEAQTLLGVRADGDFGPVSLLALKRDLRRLAELELPMSAANLGVRALAWSREEAKRCNGNLVSLVRVADYFRTCKREGAKGFGGWLAGEARSGINHAHCAAAFGYAEEQVAAPGEALPPHRAGAGELMIDAIAGHRPGQTWLPVTRILAGASMWPREGDAAIYERDGGHHVERITYGDPRGYRSLGANENGGRWFEDTVSKPYNTAKLLGFIVYT